MSSAASFDRPLSEVIWDLLPIFANVCLNMDKQLANFIEQRDEWAKLRARVQEFGASVDTGPTIDQYIHLRRRIKGIEDLLERARETSYACRGAAQKDYNPTTMAQRGYDTKELTIIESKYPLIEQGLQKLIERVEHFNKLLVMIKQNGQPLLNDVEYFLSYAKNPSEEDLATSSTWKRGVSLAWNYTARKANDLFHVASSKMAYTYLDEAYKTRIAQHLTREFEELPVSPDLLSGRSELEKLEALAQKINSLLESTSRPLRYTEKAIADHMRKT